jgi:hypothetical protein
MHYQIEYNIKGVKRQGYAKKSECEKYMTVVFHDHKDKWQISKEVISNELFKAAKPIDKEIFEYVINQNIRNL